MNTKKIIFSNSYSPRTGHNFAAQVFKVFTNHKVLIHEKSETKLSTMLKAYTEISDSKIYFKTDKDFMNHLFIDGLRSRILEKSDKEYSIVKDTSFEGVTELKKVFPDDIHILLLRDPNDVLNSLFKGMNLKKKSLKNTVKKVGIVIGVYPYFYSKKLSKKVLDVIPNYEDRTIVRFEDLVLKTDSVLEELRVLFNCNKPLEQIKEEIDQIGVINTSYYKSETGGENIWDEKKKTKKFNPVNRKAKNIFTQKGIEWGAKPLRKKLGYL